jgi:hypothetical protein
MEFQPRHTGGLSHYDRSRILGDYGKDLKETDGPGDAVADPAHSRSSRLLVAPLVSLSRRDYARGLGRFGIGLRI